MPTITGSTPGVFSWIEVMTPDVPASAAFYSSVFGWQTVDQHDDDGTLIYTMFQKDGQDVAGLGAHQPGMDGMPPIWNSYIAVDDVEKATEQVSAAGGTVIVPPMDVTTAGRMAVYEAPDGAFISAWQAGDHFGAQVANEDGAWSWNELMSRDLDAALPFYAQVFGWSYGAMDMGPLGTYHLATVDDHTMGGLMAMPEMVPAEVPNHWGIYIWVDDLEAAVARVTSNGGTPISEPTFSPGTGTFVTMSDPLGGTFSMIMPDAATPA